MVSPVLVKDSSSERACPLQRERALARGMILLKVESERTPRFVNNARRIGVPVRLGCVSAAMFLHEEDLHDCSPSHLHPHPLFRPLQDSHTLPYHTAIYDPSITFSC